MNNQTTHTPGPWFITEATAERRQGKRYEINAPNNYAVCDICGTSSSLRESQFAVVTANAHLIAAAPELLEACDRVFRNAMVANEENPVNRKWLIATMREAIAKATPEATAPPTVSPPPP